MLTIKLSNKLAYTLIAILTVLTVSLVVYAYGGNQPNVVGHTANEIEGVCKTDGTGCPASLGGTGCEWKTASSLTLQQTINNNATGFCYWEPQTGKYHSGYLRTKTGGGAQPIDTAIVSCINWEAISSDTFYYYACE